mgnify:CR=1 FL=1
MNQQMISLNEITSVPVQQMVPPGVSSRQLPLDTNFIATLRADLSRRDAIHGLPNGARRGVPGFLVYNDGVNPERAFGDFERELVRLDQTRGAPGASRRSLDYWRETLTIMIELANLLRMEDGGGSPTQLLREIEGARTRRVLREEAGGFAASMMSADTRAAHHSSWSAVNAGPNSVAALRQLRIPIATTDAYSLADGHREERSIRRLGQRKVLPEVGYAVGSIDYTTDLYSSDDEDDED